MSGAGDARLEALTTARAAAKASTNEEFNYDEIYGDGNCLFTAIADAVGSTAAEVRGKIVEWLVTACKSTDNDEIFNAMKAEYTSLKVLPSGVAEAEAAFDEDTPREEVCNAYTTAMLKSGTYGGQPEIVAASKVYNRPIVVYSEVSSSGKYGIIEHQGAPGPADAHPIYLVWLGRDLKHYDRLIPKAALPEAAVDPNKLLIKTLYDAIAQEFNVEGGAEAVVEQVRNTVREKCSVEETADVCSLKTAIGGDVDKYLNGQINTLSVANIYALAETYKRPIYLLDPPATEGGIYSVIARDDLTTYYSEHTDITGDPIYVQFTGEGHKIITLKEAITLVGGGEEEGEGEGDGGAEEDEQVALAAALLLEAAAAAVAQQERLVTGYSARRPLGTGAEGSGRRPVSTAEQLATVRGLTSAAGQGAWRMVKAPGVLAGKAGSYIKEKAVSGWGKLKAAGSYFKKKPEEGELPLGTRRPYVAPTLPENYPDEVTIMLKKVAKKPTVAPVILMPSASAAVAKAPVLDEATKAIYAAANATVIADKNAAAAAPDKKTYDIAPLDIAEGSIVGTYIVWKDHILIHQRGPTMTPAKVISTPGGAAKAGDTGKAAAKRELKEEAQFTVDGAEIKEEQMLVFRNMTVGDKTLQFYRIQLADSAVPKVGGPDAEHAAEVMNLDKNVLALPGMDTGVPTYRWVHRSELERWLGRELSLPYRDDLFFTNVQVLNALLGSAPALKGSAPDADHVPAWVPKKYFSEDDYRKATQTCGSVSFVTQDCLERAILEDIFRGKDYVENRRLAKRVDPAMIRYNELAAKKAALEAAPEQTLETMKGLESVKSKLSAEYYDEQVIIRNPKDNKAKVYKVPNPYVALAYREKDTAGPVNFANPATLANPNLDPGGKMLAANTELLNALAPTEMIADHAMAVALLESLWFCGRNPTLSNDPRCFPARLLGELREWNASKEQLARKEAVADVLGSSTWPGMKVILDSFMRVTRGTVAFPFVPPPPEKKGGEAAKAPSGGSADPELTEEQRDARARKVEEEAATAAAARRATGSEAEAEAASAAAAALKPGMPQRGTLPLLQSVPIRPIKVGELKVGALRPLVPVPLVAAK